MQHQSVARAQACRLSRPDRPPRPQALQLVGGFCQRSTASFVQALSYTVTPRGCSARRRFGHLRANETGEACIFREKCPTPFRLPEKSNTPPVHFRLLSGWRWGESAFRSVYNSGCCGVMGCMVDILHSEGFPSWVGVSSEVADFRSSSFFCCLGECVHWFTRTHFFPRVECSRTVEAPALSRTSQQYSFIPQVHLPSLGSKHFSTCCRTSPPPFAVLCPTTAPPK